MAPPASTSLPEQFTRFAGLCQKRLGSGLAAAVMNDRLRALFSDFPHDRDADPA